MSSISTEVREWFLLRDAEQRAAKMPAEQRTTLQRQVHQAQQKKEAAEALWAYGGRAEALALARAALELAHAASGADQAPPLPDEQRTEIEKALSASERLPVLDAEVEGEHQALFKTLVDLHAALDAVLLPLAFDDAERVRVRRTRVGGVAFFLIASLVFGVWLARRPVSLKTDASTSWGARFAPANVTDGVDSTEWLLPDATPGWLEVAPSKPRPFTRIKILNGKNSGNPDRGVLEADIEVWSGGRPIKTIPTNLGPFSLKPDWRSIDLGVGKTPVEKVRIVVKTWAGQGGAIAEVVLE
ncbi:MAG: discoidin domain-containing protein [Myxococcales bacterium]|nr:discoidin domain-containing protein [Myxococcales bacterium]